MSITVIELINLLEQMPADSQVVVPEMDEDVEYFGIIAVTYNADTDAVILLPE
jgi:hypothetical protein